MSLLKCPHCPRRFESIEESSEHVETTHHEESRQEVSVFAPDSDDATIHWITVDAGSAVPIDETR